MNESWLNAPLKDGRVGMSKTITVRRSELGTLRMAAEAAARAGTDIFAIAENACYGVHTFEES